MKTVNREIFCILKVPLLDTTISHASDFQLKNELPPEYRESPSFHAKDARSLLSLPLSFPFSPCGKARENDPDAGRFRTGRDPLTINEGRVGQRLLKSASRTITAACSTAAFSASVVNLPCYKKEKERKEGEEREKREGKGKGRGRGKEKGAEGKGKRREKRTRVSLSFAA